MSDKLLEALDARGIATLTLNRPDSANTYDQELLDALGEALQRLGADTRLRALVLRGAGRHFSGGGDQRRHDARAPARPRGAPPPLTANEVSQRLRAVACPTVAAIHGACIGGALGFAASCDIRIVARNASFAMPEVRLGFCVDIATALIVVRSMSLRDYRRISMTGQRFGAEEALRIGLAHELCEPGALDAAVAAQIEEILLAAPQAARRTKRMADALEPPLDPAVIEALRPLAAGRDTPEAREGLAAFKEKRRPSWYPPLETG